MPSPKSFLVIQTAFIGDVILATALVEKLKEKFPEASIDFLLRKGNEDLLKRNWQVRIDCQKPHNSQERGWTFSD